MDNIFKYNLNKNLLREVIVIIGLKRIDMKEEITVKELLDSSVMNFIMNSKFTRKQDIINFIQLVFPQPVDQFSQTKLH